MRTRGLVTAQSQPCECALATSRVRTHDLVGCRCCLVVCSWLFVFVLHFASAKSHGLCFFGVEQEICGRAFHAYFAVAVGHVAVDEQQVAHLPVYRGTDDELRFRGGNGLPEFYVQAHGVAARLAFSRHDPSASLVDECAQYSSVHGVYPSLIVPVGMPCAHDVVAVFEKLHVESERIVGRTAETIVVGMSAPRVDDSVHWHNYMIVLCLVLRCKGSVFTEM